jgi:hypothetical protein
VLSRLDLLLGYPTSTIFENLGSLAIQLDVVVPRSRYIRIMIDCRHGTLCDTSSAVDAIIWIDVEHAFIGIEALHRANYDAIGELAIHARFGHDMSHGKPPFLKEDESS